MGAGEVGHRDVDEDGGFDGEQQQDGETHRLEVQQKDEADGPDGDGVHLDAVGGDGVLHIVNGSGNAHHIILVAVILLGQIPHGLHKAEGLLTFRRDASRDHQPGVSLGGEELQLIRRDVALRNTFAHRLHIGED